MVIEDLAAGSTKKVTRGNLLRYGTVYTDQTQGWVAGSSTWTYGSATTMTVPAADAAAMAVGTKLKLTQTTVKYFYVVGISGTTITLTGGSSYTLANAAITSPYLSNAATPAGFPQWFTYTETWTGFSTAPSGGTVRFCVNGRQVTYLVYRTTDGTSNSTAWTVSLPIAAVTRANQIWQGPVRDKSSSYNTVPGIYEITSGATAANLYQDYSKGAFGSGVSGNVLGTLIYEI